MIPCRPLRVPIRDIGGKISYRCYQINAHTALKIGNRTNCSLSQKHPTRPKLVIKSQTFRDPVHQFDILIAKPPRPVLCEIHTRPCMESAAPAKFHSRFHRSAPGWFDANMMHWFIRVNNIVKIMMLKAADQKIRDTRP